MTQKKALIVFLLFVFIGYTVGCGKKPETKEERYPDGKLKIRYTYNAAGLLDGVVTRYYPNGKLQNEATYKNNLLEGIMKGYYESGTLKDEVNWKDDKPEGISKGYYENGKLRTEVNYKDGVMMWRRCYDEQKNTIQCPGK